jgi:hypothetical protein
MLWRHPLQSIRNGINQYPRIARTIIVLALIGLNVRGFLRLQNKRNPASTLERAAEAIRERDSSAFEAEADVESIAASYYDQHLLPQRLEDKTASVPGVRERDKNAVARRLRRWIETGRIDDSERPRLTLLGDFIRSALDAHSATVQEIRPAHNIAIAIADIGDRYGIHASLEIKLVRQQGFWRITEVTNVEELVHDLSTRERARIARQNRDLDAAVRIGMPVRTGPGSWRVPVNASPPISLTYSVGCTGSPGQTVPSAYCVRTLNKSGPAFLDVACGCTTAECPPPSITIHEIRRPTETLRREIPRALD